jgi:epoxyqueuosine reductase
VKDTLKEYCRSLGIEYAGIAPAGPYAEFGDRWSRRLSLGHITGFEEREFERRIDARQTMPDAESVIVCLFPYFTGSNEAANLSKSSFSLDYHLIVKSKLEQIGQFMQSKIPGFEYMAYVDNGPLSDRHMAHLAGLGYFGINGHIITDQYGSYVFIGYIINNYHFEADKPQDKTCIQCGRCVLECPGCAILGDFDINPLRCRSYITQKKGELSEQEEDILKKSPLVFGCDICQDVCPHNRDVAHTPIAEFQQNIIRNLDYQELEEISNKEFLRRYRGRAFSWRGKAILIRNFKTIHKQKQSISAAAD